MQRIAPVFFCASIAGVSALALRHKSAPGSASRTYLTNVTSVMGIACSAAILLRHKNTSFTQHWRNIVTMNSAWKPVHHLEGKVVIRTAPFVCPKTGRSDRSYMSTPVCVTEITPSGHIVCDTENTHNHVLPPDWNDDKWVITPSWMHEDVLKHEDILKYETSRPA